MTPTSSSRLLPYLRDCLAEERSRSGIRNVFASKVRARRFITGLEVATEHEFASLDLSPSVAESLGRTALLHHRESSLFYGTLFLCGKWEDKDYAAPVLLYPVEVDNSALTPQFRLQHSRVQLNPALFQLLELPSSFEEQLRELFPSGELNIVTPELLAQRLREVLPSLEINALTLFPSLASSSDVKEASSAETPVLLPASALLLTDKSKNVAGLLHELSLLEKVPPSAIPPSIHALLGEDPSTEPLPPPGPDYAPALLSPAQRRLLHSAAARPLTICHGPPGTGKSFTIAATALDHVARQESVLIACRSDEAAEVIHKKIKELLPHTSVVVRAGRKKHLRQLKAFIDRVLSGAISGPLNTYQLEQDHSVQPAIDRQLSSLEQSIAERHEEEFDEGRWHHDKKDSFWAPFRRWIHSIGMKRKPLLLDLTRFLYKFHADRLRAIDAFHQHLHHKMLREGLQSSWFVKTLRNYRAALGRRKSADQEAGLLNLDHSNLLNILPVWITTTDDIHRVLPFTPGLFDLVIIDEATQCDLASPLPILARGKRALLTGDPQQLRHLSFLSRDRLTSLGNKHQLTAEEQETFDFRRVSLIDRALDQAGASDATVFLSEHFRSLPELIRFSNKHFYHGALHFMRDPETLVPRPSGLRPHRINGTRDELGVNDAEISHTFAAYRDILNNTEPVTPPTLGFLSPFRAQVDAFLSRLQSEFSAEELQRLLHLHQFVAGTAHSFQGAERDIIHLSLVLDPASSSASRRFLERPDVFNVSITRAREELHVLHSLDHTHLPLTSLLQQYLLDAATSESSPDPQRRPSRSNETLPDLLPALQAQGWQILPHHSLAGIPVDLLLQRKKNVIAIDLIGTPGEEGAPISIPKSLLLKRAGTPLYPVSISEWINRKEDVLAALKELG